MTRVVTFGTFDVFHAGHLHILERARQLGTWLGVGLSTDAFSFEKKGRLPLYAYEERRRILAALRCVDAVFAEESLALKAEYLKRCRADVLVMGDDWRGKFDDLGSLCKVVYLPRTPSVSTTALIERIRAE